MSFFFLLGNIGIALALHGRRGAEILLPRQRETGAEKLHGTGHRPTAVQTENGIQRRPSQRLFEVFARRRRRHGRDPPRVFFFFDETILCPVRWEFLTEDGDLGFRVFYVNGDEKVDIIPWSRVDSHLVAEEGRIACIESAKCPSLFLLPSSLATTAGD